MLQKLVIAWFVITIILSGIIGVSCSREDDQRLHESRKEVADVVRLGDNIFEARDRLVENGFRIKYGPDFPTEDKDYYLMIIDYGLQPSVYESIEYAADRDLLGGRGLINGVVESDLSGRIYKIR